jgi:hypothetical protein
MEVDLSDSHAVCLSVSPSFINFLIPEKNHSIWVYLIGVINFWMPEPIFIKLGMYIMAPKSISAAHFISFSHQSVSVNPCGGEVEYLHRDPASRRRRRKGKSQIWYSKIRSQVPRDCDRERLRWQRPAAHTKDRPVLSSEMASHGMKNVTVRRIPYSERKKYLVISPRCGSTPRLTDWLTVSSNVTLTLTWLDCVCMCVPLFVARQCLGKHVPAATNKRSNRRIVRCACLWVCLSPYRC